VIAALVFRLDEKRPSLGGNLCAKARSSDPAADDNDVKFVHFPAGYEFERRAV
jgi:hypothetical protein